MIARRLALIGCGHIGGSLALALRRAGAVAEVVGFDRDPVAAERARSLGVCDRVGGALAEIDADLIVLAVPVRSIALCAAALKGTNAVVTDVGSTKAAVVAACEAVMDKFVGGHPLAGSERAGPDAADADLFTGRKAFVTPTARTSPAALALVSEMWRAAGAEVVAIDATLHDQLMAAVSHLPHVVAYTLAGALGEVDGGAALRGFAGGGFTDTTRIASTPAPMWIDVFLENRDALLPLIDGFGARLARLRAAIVDGDGGEIARLLNDARAARERILGS